MYFCRFPYPCPLYRVRYKCVYEYCYFGICLHVSGVCLFVYRMVCNALSSLLACTLYIVPGVPLINFVDDMIDNHLLVGITRAANTVMMVGGMAFGIAFAMRLLVMSDVTIDQKFSELSMVPHDGYWVYAIAAAIAAMGFATIFNIQRRLLWVVAIGGIIAVCTRNFVNFELGYGPVIGSFMGSFVVSLLAVKAVHWFHVPNHVLTIPSVIPMVPGVLMYRSLLAFINMHGVIGEVTNAFSMVLIPHLLFCVYHWVLLYLIFLHAVILPRTVRNFFKKSWKNVKPEANLLSGSLLMDL